MKKIIFISKLWWSITALSTLILFSCMQHNAHSLHSLYVNNSRLYVEIADSIEERKSGLMSRFKLDNNRGMLFVFKNSGIRRFWMKNTYIALDIAFIDSNKVIKRICTALETDDSTTVYSSGEPVQYVLEVNSGWFREHGIDVGDSIRFSEVYSEPVPR